jgi:hypothetical protein
MGFVFWGLEAPYAFHLVLAVFGAPEGPGFAEIVDLLLKRANCAAVLVLADYVFAFGNLRPVGSMYRL